MVIFSTDPKEGYLTKQGIRSIKSAFARQIYRQDLISVYERQTEYRNILQRNAQALMADLIRQMEHGTIHNEKLERLTEELAVRLQCTTGKKVYGYLPPKVKRIVDEIVDELAKDERVAKAYSLWQEMRDEVCRTYSEKLPERLPLSQQKEFKTVRNMVIRETLKFSEAEMVPEDIEPNEAPEKTELPDPAPVTTESVSSAASEEQHITAVSRAAVVRMFRHMGNIFRDNTARTNACPVSHIDRKRRKALLDKRLAMGHKADDHEDIGQKPVT